MYNTASVSLVNGSVCETKATTETAQRLRYFDCLANNGSRSEMFIAKKKRNLQGELSGTLINDASVLKVYIDIQNDHLEPCNVKTG